MTDPALADKVSLYFTEGSSDKEYHAQLSSKDDGYVVNFQYGRRGQALQSGTKTATPVEYGKARKLYDTLVAEKTKKGYTPDVSGEVFQDTNAGANFSGFLPQLPQTVRDPKQIDHMMNSPEWALQQKFDGDNRQIHHDNGEVSGINKRGIVVALPMGIVNEAKKLGDQFLASGEIIGNKLHLFDIQEHNGTDLRGKSYAARMQFLADICDKNDFTCLAPVYTATTPAEKASLVETVRNIPGGEGVVFKRVKAPFQSGKLAATQSDQFKWKFAEDCTVRVKKANAGKRSIEVEIDEDGVARSLGNVTIPSNYDIPKPGELVAVSYQHLFEDGSLYSPQYKGVRTDCEGPDTLDMFKVKPKEAARKMAM